MHSVASLLRLARRHRGGQAPGGAGQGVDLQAPRRWPTRAPHTSASRRSSRVSASPSCAEAGAPVQRPLWASTGVKNPHYAETKYVDGLVAPHTVNTMPMSTLLAAAAHAEIGGADRRPGPHGRPRGAGGGRHRHRRRDGEAARGRHQAVRGGDGRADGGCRGRARGRRHRRPPTISPRSPTSSRPDRRRVKTASAEDVAQRVWRKDETLWGGPGCRRSRTAWAG